MAAIGVQVTFDCGDPKGLGAFWCRALGYVDQPPPGGFADWDAFLDSIGWPADDRDGFWAVVDPEGVGPRLYFQRVPEGKSAKNRVHLDLNVGAGLAGDERRDAVRAHANALIAAGATELRDAEERGERWIVMQDPEGNEFCVQ